MASLEGKRALICGGSRGIGRAVAENFARSGAEVIIAAREQDQLDRVVFALLSDFGQRHSSIAADFADPLNLQRILADRLSELGPVHILLNNTGGPPGGPIYSAETDEFVDAFRKHLMCNQILVQTLVPGMQRAGFGRIINILSTSVRQPIPGLGVSNTIRGAVASWSKTLANELGPSGITVNNVLPGYTETARLSSLIASKAEAMDQSQEQIANSLISTIPLGRFARAEEIAQAVEFLASDRAAYITGINLPVDGGRIECL